jgi:hypothetical protein
LFRWDPTPSTWIHRLQPGASQRGYFIDDDLPPFLDPDAPKYDRTVQKVSKKGETVEVVIPGWICWETERKISIFDGAGFVCSWHDQRENFERNIKVYMRTRNQLSI